MLTHICITGEAVTYPEPPPALAGFISTVRAAVEDETVTENDLIRLLYGIDNPLLVQGIIPGRGAVTREVLQNPVYHVLLDLLAQKQSSTGRLDKSRLGERFTMSVGDAAEKLGISRQAVIGAIHRKRLAAHKSGDTWFVDPASVDGYMVSKRGPQSAARQRSA